MTRKEISNCLGDHPRRNTRIILYESTYKVYTFYYMWHWGEILVDIKMHPFCYQKVATRSRSVSVHLDFSYDASRAHRRGRGDKTKI